MSVLIEYLYSKRGDFERTLDEEKARESSIHIMKNVLVGFALTVVLLIHIDLIQHLTAS